jgi:hypothetical protein
MEAAPPADFSPPYISFRTLLNAVQRMQDEGIPARLDRSYLSNLPWSSQNHFLAASRGLGLIDEEGKPLDRLVALVEQPDQRPEIIAAILRDRYAGPLSLGVNATQEQLEEQFKPYGLGGSTMRKAIAFYLHAARYADLPLSPHFRSPRTTDRPASPRRRTRTKQADAPPQAADEGNAQATITSSDLHPFLQGLLRELPEEGAAWTGDKRGRWLQMAELTVDMLYPVEDK